MIGTDINSQKRRSLRMKKQEAKSNYKLLPIEKETVILFNEAEKLAHVTSTNAALTKK